MTIDESKLKKKGIQKVAIVCDDWKLPTFEKVLQESGYTNYEKLEDKKLKCWVISIRADPVELEPVVKRAQHRCRKLRSKRNSRIN